MGECNILFLQENCLYKCHLHKLKKFNANADFAVKSQINENVPLECHPHGGGGAIIYNTNMQCIINEVKCNHERLCDISLHINACKISMLNAYVPCDSY